MPTIAQSQSAAIERQLGPASAPLAQGAEMMAPASPPPPDQLTASMFMVSSMPALAATGDQFTKQFYDRSAAPITRVLRPGLTE